MSHYGRVWQEKRQRVCEACLRAADFVFGRLHSEASCHRCGKKCGYGAVVGPSPFAEAT